MWTLVVITLWLLAMLIFSQNASGRIETVREVFGINSTHIIAYNSILSDYSRFMQEGEKSQVKSLIIATAITHNIDSELLQIIAKCESGFKINAKNPTSTASGIFQWLDSSFLRYATIYGLPLDKKNDPYIQAELTAKVIRDGGVGNWNASKECWSI